jgi:NitT/TauT family transport system substrate-binding protein
VPSHVKQSANRSPSLSAAPEDDTGLLDRRGFLARAGIAAGGLAVFGLAGCGGSSQGGSVSNGAYTGQQAVSHLDEIIAAAPFKIAEAEGYFADAKLKVKSISFAGGGDVVRAIQTKMDFGMPATLPTLIAYEKALQDLRIVGSVFNAPEVVFLVSPKSSIRSVKDLRGKKIGVSEPGSNSTYFGDLVARRSGLTPGKDVTMINAGGPADAFTAMELGVVDAAWSAPPFSTKQIHASKARLLVDSGTLTPHWVDTALVTKQEFIDSNPDVLRKWIAAVGKAIDLIRSDPAAAGRAWSKTVPLDPAVTTKALRDYRKAFSLTVDQAGVAANVQAGKALGQLKSTPPLDKIINTKFLPAGAGT